MAAMGQEQSLGWLRILAVVGGDRTLKNDPLQTSESRGTVTA